VLNIKINTVTLPIHKNFISQKRPASACIMSERATLEEDNTTGKGRDEGMVTMGRG